MSQYNLLLPKMGESVAEATIIKWNKAVGDRVEIDDTVIEIATDKVDSEVPSPVAGKLIRQLYKENDVVQVGAVIAIIETGENSESAPVISAQPVVEESPNKGDTPPINKMIDEIPGVEQLKNQSSPGNTRFYSPLVKNIASQENVSLQELETIAGTGIEGRLTKDDLLLYVKERKKSFNILTENDDFKEDTGANFSSRSDIKEQVISESGWKVSAESTGKETITSNTDRSNPNRGTQNKPVNIVGGGDEIIEMDRMRRLIADHMLASVQTSPHVTSFIEADVTNLVLWREKIKTSFEKREGNKITFTPIFIETVARAIKDFPMINISVNGTQIIKKKDINIGMAAALPSGNLIVPVIRRADELNLIGLTKAVNDLASRARNNKLQPDEVKDGTFTITNIGSFGNLMGTPIINQPQVAILAVGAIKKKPAVIETETGDMIAIRHMMFLSLSYDHRVVDGALGGLFLRKIADYLEAWDINREI